MVDDLSPVFVRALTLALGQYQHFMDQNVSLESKDFTAHHNACKSVLGHVGLLLKLLNQTESVDAESNPDWTDLLEKARAETRGWEDEIYAEFD